MINSNLMNLNQAKLFQVRRAQMPKVSPLLKNPQSSSMQNEIQSLNQLNMQLITKNKILTQRLKAQLKLNEQLMADIKRFQDQQTEFEQQLQDYKEKIEKQKMKKKELKEQIETLKKELEDLQNQNNQSNNDINMDDEEGDNQNVPLTHNQLYQLMQYLQQRAQHQQWLASNYQDYQEQDIDPDVMTYEQLLELEEQIGNVSKGLTNHQIKQIPKRILDGDVPDDKCPVCLYEFKEQEKVRELQCKHIYHSKCIKNWLQSNKACPLCKIEVIIPGNENEDDDDLMNEQNQECEEEGEMTENQANDSSQQSQQIE